MKNVWWFKSDGNGKQTVIELEHGGESGTGWIGCLNWPKFKVADSALKQ